MAHREKVKKQTSIKWIYGCLNFFHQNFTNKAQHKPLIKGKIGSLLDFFIISLIVITAVVAISSHQFVSQVFLAISSNAPFYRVIYQDIDIEACKKNVATSRLHQNQCELNNSNT